MLQPKNKILLFSAIGIIFIVYFSPFFIYGQDAYVLIHDNLDSNVIWFKILAGSGKLFSSNTAIIPNIMNGLPRSSFSSEYNFIQLLYFLFPPFSAYVINLLLIHLTAFIGSYLLLKNYLLKERNLILISLSALCFSLLPFWPSGGIGIAGQPLLVYLFLNILNNRADYKNYLLIIFIPFYSSFIFSQLFLFVFIGIYGIYCWRKKIGNYRSYFIALFVITIIHLLIEYRLLMTFVFGQGFISHRTEFAKEELNIREVVSWAFAHFKHGQYHSESLQSPFLFILAGVAIIAGLLYRQQKVRTVILLLCIAGSISLFYKLLIWDVFVNSGLKINILKVFQVERFYTLFPFLWFLILVVSLDLLVRIEKKAINYFIYGILGFQLLFCIWSFDSFKITYSKKILKTESIKSNEFPSYKEFYSTECFNKIKNYIGKDQSAYRIVNLGIDPAVTLYNGFYNLDAYMPNYPLSYKHTFRNVIEKELNKNEQIKKNFDNWGSRCYLFVSGMDQPELNNLELNFDELRSLNCSYIFSVKKINNLEKNISLMQVFTNQYPGNVYVYKVL